MSRRGRGADGRNGGSDGYGRDGQPAGVRRVGLGRGRHRVGRHRADLPQRQQHQAAVRGVHSGPAGPVMADRPDLDLSKLDGLAGVPDQVLFALVAERGRCISEVTSGEPPGGLEPARSGPASPDRDLAAWLCVGCSVRAECAEFELRTAGANTAGVWGGLAEDDRRELHAARSARTRPGQSHGDQHEQRRPAPAEVEERTGVDGDAGNHGDR